MALLVLVGDPRQLRAGVYSPLLRNMSAKAAALRAPKQEFGCGGYEYSLMERLMASGAHYHSLHRQYRMHPEISKWSTKYFYPAKVSVPGRRGAEGRVSGQRILYRVAAMPCDT